MSAPGLWTALLGAVLGGSLRERTAGAGIKQGSQFKDAFAATLLGQHALFWWLAIVAFLCLAYLTNPNEASLRAHLTDLSFRLHLKRLQASDQGDIHGFSAPGDYKHSNNNAHQQHPAVKHGQTSAKARKDVPGSRPADHAAKNSSILNGDNGRPHVLSFSNRVSISLRTPAYVRASYIFFSTVKILPVSTASPKGSSASSGKVTPAVTSGTPNKKHGAKHDATKKRNEGGLVSAIGHGLSAQISSNPWMEQGGYFIGFLGYWWTIDDGTSYSGQRERARLDKAILAFEEQDEDQTVSDQHKVGAVASPDTLEEGLTGSTDSSSKGPASSDTSTANGLNGHMSGGKQNNRQKLIKNLTTGNAAMFRGGQRRSHPAARNTQIKGTKRQNSGETTPVSPTPPVPGPAKATSEQDANKQDRRDLLSIDADKNLPGLPFHVDSANAPRNPTAPAAAPSSNQVAVNAASTAIEIEHGKSADDSSLSLAAHSASAPEADLATVSPTCALLQSQLDDLRASTTATQAKLQTELEELQTRRRDEDSVRTELKARTKALEETKRSAELERQETERKLISAKSNKKGLEDRVSKSKAELSKLEKREKELHERASSTRAERAEKLAKLKEDVRQREAVLKKEEEATGRLASRVDSLEAEIEQRKSELAALKEETMQTARLRMSAGRGAGAMAPSAHHQHPNAASARDLAALFDNHHAAAAGLYGQMSQNVPASVSVADEAHREPSPGQVSGAFTYKPDASSATGYSAPFNVAPGSFFDHRSQRLGPSANSMMTGSNTSSINTSVLGNSASAASALYNRQLREDIDARRRSNSLAQDDSPALGTFAPFGPNPVSPVATGAGSTGSTHDLKSPLRAAGSVTPGQTHAPYFASDKHPHLAQAEDAIVETRSRVPSNAMPPAGARHSPGSGAGAIGMGRHAHTLSDDLTQEALASLHGGPLSPMTPHQASLIPSQLFDMLDDVEMPASPSPHLAYTSFNETAHGRDGDSGSPSHLNKHTFSPSSWDAFDDIGFGPGAGHGYSALSRRVSDRNKKDGASASPQHEPASTTSTASDSIFSPALTSASTVHSSNSGSHASNRASPHDLLFDRARHALALNPDAKSFSFNRPLPASSSIRGDARLAFEGGGSGGLASLKQHGSLSSLDLQTLIAGSQAGNTTWTSPLPSSRVLGAGTSSLYGAPGQGHGHSGSGSSHGRGHAHGIGSNSSAGMASKPAGSTFSPFDDDDLLKKW